MCVYVSAYVQAGAWNIHPPLLEASAMWLKQYQGDGLLCGAAVLLFFPIQLFELPKVESK